MKDFIEFILQNILETPEDITVFQRTGKQSLLIEIHACEKNLARIIGRKGNTIKAIREVATLTAKKLDKKIVIEVVDSES